jgi:DNA-binding CsgD family transcriptional regulator
MDRARNAKPMMHAPNPVRIDISDRELDYVMRTMGLSTREAEVARLVMRGYAEQNIARELCISSHTVRSHLKRTYSKVGARGRCEFLMRVFGTYLSLCRHADAEVSFAPQSSRAPEIATPVN